MVRRPQPMIFVFGSNLLGIHGAGAALTAKMYYGAENGIGEGLQGRSYAIPTKKTPKESLPLEEIQKGVNRFIECVKSYPDRDFLLTAIGCGLAGYKVEQIAPLFQEARKLPNVSFPDKFLDYYKTI